MNSRGLLGLALTLLLSAVALVALPGTMGAAHAAVVQPCTVTYTSPAQTIPAKGTNPSHSFIIAGFGVTDTRVVTDLALAVDVTHASGGNLSLHLHGTRSDGIWPAIQAHNNGQTTGAWDGRYSFDEETGAAPMSGTNPVAGLYKPVGAESLLEGPPPSPPTDSWGLWILNTSDVAGTLRSATLTLTYATCDSDGDGVEEKVDNCPTVANDQANHDSDALGDGCDLDMDGDALANTTDGCPLTAASTKTGCPTASRTARLTYITKKHRLAVVVRSTVPGCRADAKVTLHRKKPGRDTKLLVSTTNSQGRYRLKAPRDAGRYYVTVAKSYATGQAECGTARSKVARVPRRR